MNSIPVQKSEPDIVQHQGIFYKKRSLWEGVAILMSGTIGAGVLGIPFAIAKVGIGLGIIYIVIIGLLMMGLNVLVGAIAVKTKTSLQLVGLAEKYLGMPGKIIMTLLVYLMLFGVLVVYIIGQGETLAELFGGSTVLWSTVFFFIGSAFIYIGLRTVKTLELLLTLGILAVVLVIAAVSAPHIQLPNFQYIDITSLFLPYGVLLFAFHGATAVPEVYSTLKKKEKTFKQSITLAGLIVIAVYTVFAIITVGVLGQDTTEIATIGLGEVIGPTMFYLGNIFAILAMGTSFLMAGIALRDSMCWDFKMPYGLATIIVCVVPFIIYLAGLRQFIAAIDIVGGVFMSLEMLLILLIYWRAKQKGDMSKGPFHLHHVVWLGIILTIMLLIGAFISLVHLFS